jgi:hypothetical protein
MPARTALVASLVALGLGGAISTAAGPASHAPGAATLPSAITLAPAQAKAIHSASPTDVSRARTAYRALGTRAARQAAQTHFRQSLAGRGQGAPQLAPGTRITRFIDDHTARIERNGRRGLLESSLPLRTAGPGGHKVAIDIGLAKRGGRFVPRRPLVRTTFGTHAGDGLALAGLVSAVPATAAGRSATRALRLGTDRLFYANTAADTDFIAESTLLGFEAYWQLRSPTSPERHVLRQTLAPGVKLRQREQTVYIIRDGHVAGRILPPQASDAAGRPVQVSQLLRGRELDLFVSHRRAGVRYPVLVDPGYVTDDWVRTGLATWHHGNPDGLEAWSAYSNNGIVYTGNECDALSLSDCDDGNTLGLFIHAKPGSYLDGHGAFWQYQAQGQGNSSWITTLQGAFVRVSSNGGPASTAATMYIANSGGGAIYANSLGSNYGPGSPAVSDNGAAGHGPIARFQLTMAGAGSRSTYNTMSVGGALVQSYENTAPSLQSAGLGWSEGTWYNGAAPISANPNFLNTGFGVARNEWITYKPGDWVPQSRKVRDQALSVPNGGCDGTYLRRCAYTFQSQFEIPTAQMPEGINVVQLVGWSPTGGGSDAWGYAYNYRVDRSPPTVNFGGTLGSHDGGTITAGASYDWNAVVTDCTGSGAALQRSGVKIVNVAVDAVPAAPIYIGGITNPNFMGSSEQCQLSTPLSAVSFAPGPHTITITASDWVGLATTSVLNVTAVPPVTPPPVKPVNTAAPSIAGAPMEGQQLGSTDGTWTGTTPMSTTYQWQRCDTSGAQCVDIAGATASGYTPFFGEIGSSLRVGVTKQNGAGATTAYSPATALVDTGLTTPAHAFVVPQDQDEATTPSYVCQADTLVFTGSTSCSGDSGNPEATAAAADQNGLTQRGYGISENWHHPQSVDATINPATGQPYGGLFGGPYLVEDLTQNGCTASGDFNPTSAGARYQQDSRFSAFRPTATTGLQKVRLIVPFDVMKGRVCPSAGTLPADQYEAYRRAYFRASEFIASAHANGETIMVSFERSVLEDDPFRQTPAPPVLDTANPNNPNSYDHLVRQFVSHFGSDVRDYTAWNEPNHPSQPTSMARDGGSGSGAQMAARYYRWLRDYCSNTASPRCFVGAGDFYDQSFPVPARLNPTTYFRIYAHAVGAPPTVWAFHAYDSLNRSDNNDGRLRNLINWTADPDLETTVCASGQAKCRPRIWLTEQGSLVYAEGSDGTASFGQKCMVNGHPNPSYQTAVVDANTNLSSFFARIGSLPDSSRITRFYYYDWAGTPTWDAGLLYAMQHGVKQGQVEQCQLARQSRPALPTYRDQVLNAPLP